MGDAVRQPGEDIENDGLVGGQNVAQVCTIEDVFKGRQHANPDRRSVFAVDESGEIALAWAEAKGETMESRQKWHVLAGEEEDEPCGNWQEWQEELASDGQQQRQHQ